MVLSLLLTNSKHLCRDAWDYVIDKGMKLKEKYSNVDPEFWPKYTVVDPTTNTPIRGPNNQLPWIVTVPLPFIEGIYDVSVRHPHLPSPSLILSIPIKWCHKKVRIILSPREHHTSDNSACTRTTTPHNLHPVTHSVYACEDRFQTYNTLCILPHAYGDVPPYFSTVQNAPVLSTLYSHSPDTPLLSTRQKQRRFRAILQVLVESTFSLIRCLLPSCGICLSFLQRILAHQNFRGVRNLTRVRHILTTKARLLVCRRSRHDRKRLCAFNLSLLRPRQLLQETRISPFSQPLHHHSNPQSTLSHITPSSPRSLSATPSTPAHTVLAGKRTGPANNHVGNNKKKHKPPPPPPPVRVLQGLTLNIRGMTPAKWVVVQDLPVFSTLDYIILTEHQLSADFRPDGSHHWLGFPCCIRYCHDPSQTRISRTAV